MKPQQCALPLSSSAQLCPPAAAMPTNLRLKDHSKMRNLLSNLEAVLPQFCIAERCEFNCHSHPQMAYHSAHRNFCCAHHFPSTRPRHPGIERGRRKKLKSLEAPLYQTDPTNTYEHIPILLVGYASYASSVRMPRCHTEGASVRSTASNLTELCIRTVALVIPQIADQLKRQGQKENRRKTEGLDFE